MYCSFNVGYMHIVTTYMKIVQIRYHIVTCHYLIPFVIYVVTMCRYFWQNSCQYIGRYYVTVCPKVLANCLVHQGSLMNRLCKASSRQARSRLRTTFWTRCLERTKGLEIFMVSRGRDRPIPYRGARGALLTIRNSRFQSPSSCLTVTRRTCATRRSISSTSHMERLCHHLLISEKSNIVHR